ncbi:MAG TPA: MoaD/ThiS family protein [Acidimicrobiales bacterium]
MAQLLLFGPARDAVGHSKLTVPGDSVAAIVAAAEEQFGEAFSRVLAVSNVWLNGHLVAPDTHVSEDDEIAVIPPVSGG